MILAAMATALFFMQDDLPKPVELQHGELVRFYERSMGKGIYVNVLVLTPNKAYIQLGENRGTPMLTGSQQVNLAEILRREPIGLKSKRRDKPAWPSSYDAQDQWITYRVGQTVGRWSNDQFEYPTENCPLIKFIEDVKKKLSNEMIQKDGTGLPRRKIPITKDGGSG